MCENLLFNICYHITFCLFKSCSALFQCVRKSVRIEFVLKDQVRWESRIWLFRIQLKWNWSQRQKDTPLTKNQSPWPLGQLRFSMCGWDWKKNAVAVRSSWYWLLVWLPRWSLVPCLQGKQDSARLRCFMSWSQPKSPHSHKHRTWGRDSGHAAAAARPQAVCTDNSRTCTNNICF